MAVISKFYKRLTNILKKEKSRMKQLFIIVFVILAILTLILVTVYVMSIVGVLIFWSKGGITGPS